MNYKVIAGTFHVKGYAPDGDSIRFQANDPAHWAFFDWSSASKADDKKHQLRIEAIDALETHYEGVRQPPAFALAALERMLELLGISDVTYNLLVTKITAAKDGARGFIVSGGIDKFDRPICFVFDEKAPLTDGAELRAEDIPLTHSVNYKLAGEAIVYPTFYSTMEPFVIETFRKVFLKVKNNRQGLWAIDKTGGFKLWNPRTVQDDVIIMPKLFRRFISFFEARSDMSEFKAFMKANNDKIIVNGKPSTFYDILKVYGNHYRLTVSPEEIVFVP